MEDFDKIERKKRSGGRGRKGRRGSKTGKKRRDSKLSKGSRNRDKEDRSIFEKDYDEEDRGSDKDENTEVLTNKQNQEEDIFERDSLKPESKRPKDVPKRKPRSQSKPKTLIMGKDPTLEKEIPDAQTMPGDMKCYRNSILCVSAFYLIFTFSAFPYLM